VEKPDDEDDKLSFTDLDEKPAEAKVEIPEVDLMSELDSKAEDDGLVLNL
jgi:hypothetical protein